MNGFLLDTNIPSELTRKPPALEVIRWFHENVETPSYLSVITVGELQKGFALLPHGKRRTELELWFSNHLLPLFTDKVLPVIQAIASRWGHMSAHAQRRGLTIGTSDGCLL